MPRRPTPKIIYEQHFDYEICLFGSQVFVSLSLPQAKYTLQSSEEATKFPYCPNIKSKAAGEYMEVSASSQNVVPLHSKISKLKHKLLSYLPSAWSLSEKKTCHKLLGFFGVLFITQL